MEGVLKMKKALKIIIGIGIVLLLIVVIGVVVLFVSMESIIKTGVTTYGPPITGTKIELDSVGISFVKGKVTINNFVVGNPKGYKSPYAFKLGNLVLDVDINSLFTNEVVVNKIYIENMEVNFEPHLTTYNLRDIQKNIEKFTKGSDEKVKEPEAEPEKTEEAQEPTGEKKPEKKFKIKTFDLKDGKITVSATLLDGKGITVTMAPVHMENVTKDSAASIDTVVLILYDVILKTIVKAVEDSPETLKELKNIDLDIDTGKAVDSIEKGASGVVDKVKSLF